MSEESEVGVALENQSGRTSASDHDCESDAAAESSKVNDSSLSVQIDDDGGMGRLSDLEIESDSNSEVLVEEAARE